MEVIYERGLIMTTTIAPLLSLSRKHVLALIFACVTGALVLLPQIVFIVNEGSHYKGLYMMNREAEPFYLSRMHEFYDEGRIGNLYLFEHKYYGPQFLQSGAETLLAIPGKLLDISVPTLNLIYKFFLPAITFLLVYGLLFRLTASATWAVAGGLFVIVGHDLLYAINLLHLLRGDLWFDGFVYNRPVHPMFDGILTFLYLNVLLFAHKGGEVRWFVVLAALLGLSFYTYLYSFTFFLALNFIFAALWLFSGKKKEVRDMVFATIGGILLGIPQILVMYAAFTHPDYAHLAAIYTPLSGHSPEISKNGLVVSFFFIIYLFRFKAFQALENVRENVFFLSGLLLTTFAVVNQQVLTGIRLQSGHYFHIFNIPIFIIVLTFLASTVISHLRHQGAGTAVQGGTLRIVSPRPTALAGLGQGSTLYFTDIFYRALPLIASLIFIATGSFMQYSSYQHWAYRTSDEQRFMPIFAWLNAETPKESVVMANANLSELIPLFANNNVMWAPNAGAYLLPADRTRFTPENLLRSDDFLRDIKQYRVDYILWDQQADPNWNIDRLHLPQLFSSGGLVIYQLPK